jgi:regulator of sigma E protease
MLDSILPVLAPIFVFGIVVFVHELGHFLAAKAMGVYAPRFSIGFGPALLRKRWGETEYVLAALPLGGYVRMASREDESMAFIEGGGEHVPGEVPTTGANAAGRAVEDHAGAPSRARDWDPEAMAPFGPRPVPEHRWFESKSLPARLLILLAGVTMNVLLTLVVSIGVFATYGRPYVPDNLPAVVDSVIAGQPAARAGLLAGDTVVAIGGAPIATWSELVTRVSAVTSGDVTLDVARAGARQRLTVRPTPTEVTDSAGTRTVGRIGVAPRVVTLNRPMGFGEAVRSGWDATWFMAGSVVTVVQRLATGRESVSNLGGPITIARTSVAAGRDGPEAVLYLLAFLSVNIAVLNLLPIPVLDGGQVLINVLESAKGSAFSMRTREYILRAGLVAIGLLFVTVMWNDITRLIADVVQ